MKSSPLTGITTASFDSLEVRDPRDIGPMKDILTLINNTAYDDTALAGDVATNAATIATNTSAIALKRNIADSYTKS